MSGLVGRAHDELHSEHGPHKGEHAGRSRKPVIKVRDIAWLEFDKPDLVRAEAFAHAFGFATVTRSLTELVLRGADTGAPCLLIRRGDRSRFRGMAFAADDELDVQRVAQAEGLPTRPLPESLGGITVNLVDPSGIQVRVVAGTHRLPPLPAQLVQSFNTGHHTARVNVPQRPPYAPAQVQRLGHVVLQSSRYRRALDWYLNTLGMIVSDFQFFPGQRHRGPVMSFIRCDRGSSPVDHHTLAMLLGPSTRYVHSAFQVCDLDALAVGGEYLARCGYRRSWGIGRHVEGSQIFDYWRDPDGFLVEHFTDGDMFDHTVAAGWSPFTATGLAQWGPTASADFLGTGPRALLQRVGPIISALGRRNNEFELASVAGLLRVSRS